MYVGQDHGLSGMIRTQKDVPVLTKHYRLDKIISYECSLIAKMDSVHRRCFTEKVETESFSRFSLPSLTDYCQMLDVLSGTADKRTRIFTTSRIGFCFYKLQDSRLKKVLKVSPPPLIFVLLEHKSHLIFDNGFGS